MQTTGTVTPRVRRGFTDGVLGGLVIGSTLLTGCMVGPDYHRPEVAVPGAYSGAAPAAETPGGGSLGDEKWWNVFQDVQLQALVRTALNQNFDVRIAATRMLEAQAQLGIARGDELPGAAVQTNASEAKNAKSQFFPPYNSSLYQIGVGFQWNIDFWGKYRRATEAARAELLASDWAKQAVVGSLVANVAAAYFTLRAQDLQLEIAKRTLTSDQNSLQLTQLLSDSGAVSLLDVRQAEELVYTAAGVIPILERQIQQEQDFISTLLGAYPADVPRGLELTAEPHAPEIPTGLPSSLLERRPDIRAAEAQLMAANARIGVAKAAYFPAIGLTGAGGFASDSLARLFSGPAGAWSFLGSLTEPLYAGGSLRNGVRLSEAQRQEALLTYQQTIQQAFREVADTLVAYSKDQEFRKQQELLTRATEDATRLSDLRYQGGASSYLEVLDSDTRYFSAELTLAQAQMTELLDYVQLYRALGGGWQQ
jgi:multidrug efflux system outer membrane protein